MVTPVTTITLNTHHTVTTDCGSDTIGTPRPFSESTKMAELLRFLVGGEQGTRTHINVGWLVQWEFEICP